MRIVFEGFRCGNRHLIIERNLEINEDGEKMCPHCESTDISRHVLYDDSDDRY